MADDSKPGDEPTPKAKAAKKPQPGDVVWTDEVTRQGIRRVSCAKYDASGVTEFHQELKPGANDADAAKAVQRIATRAGVERPGADE